MCGCAICTLLHAKRPRQFRASKEVNSKVNMASSSQATAREAAGSWPKPKPKPSKQASGLPCHGGEPRSGSFISRRRYDDMITRHDNKIPYYPLLHPDKVHTSCQVKTVPRITRILANTHLTSKLKHSSTSKHSPFHHVPDNVHMIASTMRVEEDIFPLRPP